MADQWIKLASKNDKGQRMTYKSTGNPKGVLHTTESSGWPGYRGWTVNPHFTIKPKPGKGIEARQHVPLNYASFALRNLPGGVETNRDDAVQIELVGTCDKKGPGYYWPGADDVVLLALAKVIFEISAIRGIPIKAPKFKAFPASYGKTDVRMSGIEFHVYSGWCGHLHVDENSHGDPGDFPWDRMISLYNKSVKQVQVPPTTVKLPIYKSPLMVLPKTITKVWSIQKNRMRGNEVLAIRRALGAKMPIWPVYDQGVAKAVSDFQRHKGLHVDGIVGPDTARAMGLVWKG